MQENKGFFVKTCQIVITTLYLDWYISQYISLPQGLASKQLKYRPDAEATLHQPIQRLPRRPSTVDQMC